MLNHKQHKAFVLAGHKFLEAITSQSDAETDQFIGFLGGLPGAGKSQVIKALQALAQSWGSEKALRTVAYQGVAAEAANGQTIHKLFGWGVKENKGQQKRYSIEQKEEFAQLEMLIMDEVSTTDVRFIGKIDAALRELKKEPNKVFGGVHIVFVGDWLQQLPVMGYPAYISHPPDPSRRRQPRNGVDNEAAKYMDRVRGIAAYRMINEVIILEENVRHRDDPAWRDILGRWRVGDYREADITFVNNQCYHKNWRSESMAATAYCPIIVTSNALRSEFNEEALHSFCQEKNEPLHCFPADVSHARSKLTRGQRRSLNKIRDDKTEGMPMILQIAIGMPVQGTKNVSRALRLANGTIGHVVSIISADDDTESEKSVNNLRIVVHTKPPDVVLIRLLDPILQRETLVEGLPAGVIPVRLWEKRDVQVRIRNRSFTLKVKQAPLVPAFSLTSEKCQGLTVTKMVIAPLRHHTRNQPQRSSFYVAATRVKTLNGLFLMELLTLEYLSYFKPVAEALAETRRLEQLEVLCDERRALGADSA